MKTRLVLTVLGVVLLLVLTGCDAEQARLKEEAKIAQSEAEKAQYDAFAAQAQANAEQAAAASNAQAAQAQAQAEQARAQADVQIAQSQAEAQTAQAQAQAAADQVKAQAEALTAQAAANERQATAMTVMMIVFGLAVIAGVGAASYVAVQILRTQPQAPATVVYQLPALQRPQLSDGNRSVVVGQASATARPGRVVDARWRLLTDEQHQDEGR